MCLFTIFCCGTGLGAQINSLLNNPEERGTHVFEQEMFADAATHLDSLRTNNLLLKDSSLVNYLYRVTDRLLPGQRALTPWEVYVEKDLTPNASALPDGSLLITTGLLLRFDSEAQLAFVLAHELAHYLYRHALRHRVVAEESNTLFKSRLALKNAKFSREMEWDADAIALILYARAGYPEDEAAEALRRLPAELNYRWIITMFYGIKPRNSPYRTHPRTPERIEKIVALSADTEFSEAPIPDGYQAYTKRVNLASRKALINGMPSNSNATKARQIDSLFVQMGARERATSFFWEMKLAQSDAWLNLLSLPTGAASMEIRQDKKNAAYRGESTEQEESVNAPYVSIGRDGYVAVLDTVENRLRENIEALRTYAPIAHEADRLEGILLYEKEEFTASLPFLKRYLEHEDGVTQKRYVRYLIREIQEQKDNPKKKKKSRKKRN